MEHQDTQLQPSSMRNLETLLLLTYDENADKESKEYRLQFNKRLLYLILKVIERNKSITTNQVCGLLRNTLQVPDAITKMTINAMINGIDSIQNLNKILRSFPTKRGAVHLNLVGDLSVLNEWMEQLLKEFPELEGYKAPAYQKGPVFKLGEP